MNYSAILLFKREQYAENDAFELEFQVYSDQNDLQTDLSAFKFYCRITNDADVLNKKDANYSGGSDAQISVSSDKITVHVDSDDTNAYEGLYVLELQMTNKTTGFRQTIYRENFEFFEEVLNA